MIMSFLMFTQTVRRGTPQNETQPNRGVSWRIGPSVVKPL